MQLHLIERRSHDYVRHCTNTLFAALNLATRKVTARCQPRHYAAHKHKKMRD